MPEVVVVSVYYRLASFGFLSHPAFTTNPELGDLNAGFLDQTEALHWVQKYISAFGGDPDQVTINGGSAGGSSVELHLVAPQNEGLFTQAIAQSVYRAALQSPEQAQVCALVVLLRIIFEVTVLTRLYQAVFDLYAMTAGCGSGSISEQMSCLRNASISALAAGQDAVM